MMKQITDVILRIAKFVIISHQCCIVNHFIHINSNHKIKEAYIQFENMYD